MRAEDASGTPTKSYISPSVLVYEDKGLFSYVVPISCTSLVKKLFVRNSR